MADLRSPLGRARGLGSAKDGAAHWWAQRVTAVALVPLTLWFVASVVGLTGAGHGAVIEWLADPLVAVPMILYLAMGCYHAVLGFQVIVEDYVHKEWQKVALIIGIKFGFVLLAGVGIFSILKIALGE